LWPLYLLQALQLNWALVHGIETFDIYLTHLQTLTHFLLTLWIQSHNCGLAVDRKGHGTVVQDASIVVGLVEIPNNVIFVLDKVLLVTLGYVLLYNIDELISIRRALLWVYLCHVQLVSSLCECAKVRSNVLRNRN